MPQRLLTKIGSFEQGQTTRVFRFRASPSDEASFGKLFGLGESANKEEWRHLKTLENLLGEYYNPAARSRWARGRNLSPESLFEELLHEANEELALQGLGAAKSINAVIALHKDNALHLSSHGSSRALLFRARGQSHFQHFDLLKLREASESTEDLFFSHVISGELLAGDAVVLLSQKFLEKLTLREVEQAIMLNPQGGAAFLQNQLEAESEATPLAAIILRRVAEESNLPIRSGISPRSSVDILQKTERATERVLAPQTFPHLKEFLASIALRESKPNRRRNFPRRREKIFFRALKRVFKTLAGLVRAILLKTVSAARFFFSFASGLKGRRAKELLLGAVKKIKGALATMPRLSKTALFVGLALIAVFTLSAALAARRNFQTEKERAWNELYNEAAAIKDEIESSLIYGDQDRASKLLKEAELNLTALSTEGGKKHQKEISNLAALLSKTASKVRRIIDIENPDVFFVLPDIPSGYDSLTLKKEKLTAAGAAPQAAGAFVQINIADKSYSADAASGLLNGSFIFARDENTFYAFSKNESLMLQNGEWKKMTMDAKNRSSFGETEFYGDRLYVLDQAGDNIWRYSKTKNGFDEETPWLKEPNELQSISSFAVDSSLYLLDNRGNIRKFYRGREQEFHLSALEPPFGTLTAPQSTASGGSVARPGKIKTGSESGFLYALDPAGQRLIVWQKDGTLSAQYFSSKFDDLRDVAWNENKKEIYLLNNKTIFSVPAAHLDKK